MNSVFFKILRLRPTQNRVLQMKKTILSYFVLAAFAVTTVFGISSCDKIREALYDMHTVTFDLNYEGNPAATTVKVEEGKTVKKPSNPVRPGWEFVGWFKESSGRTAWNFDTEIVSDITIYAKWSAITFTVTFNSNGGSEVRTQTVSYGGKVAEPTKPTRVGHRFDGWYKDNTFANAWSFVSETVTANIALYAKWTPVYNVTFDTDGGSDAPELQAIGVGENVTKPIDPTKSKAGLYNGTVKPEDVRCTFEGWYNGETQWNFATDFVTNNITLTAKWSGGGNPIAAVAANDIPTTFTYINNNAGTYTLLINRDISVSTTQTISLAQRHLTIAGLGGGRKITINHSYPIIINNTDASLTLDENIILTDETNNYFSLLSYYLVRVQAGSLIMRSGSKIIEGDRAVEISGVNSRFVMEGGEIRNNNSYGVLVYSGASFVMKGGKVSGTTYDVYIENTAGTFTLSGNAEIGTLTLHKVTNGTNSSVTIGEGGFTGIVSALHLYVSSVSNISTVVDQWTTGVTVPTVMRGVTNADVLSRFTLGKFIGSSNSTQRDISPEYKLELVGGGNVKLVWR